MFTIKVDPIPAQRFLDDVSKKQIPFALSKAIAKTGLEVQAFQRKHDAQVFTVRRADWLEKTVKVTKFPTKQKPAMTIAIQPPGATGAQRADIIGKFETDTSKESSREMGHVAIPIRARRNKRDIIIGKNRPKNMNLREVSSVRTRRVRAIGDFGTFIVHTLKGFDLILQRTKRGVFALYYLVKRVPIAPELHFQKNAETVVPQVFPAAFDQAFTEAMRTAR